MGSTRRKGRYQFNPGKMKALRESAGLTQRAIAEAAAVDVNTIAAYEQGKRRHPSAEIIYTVADELGVSDREFFDVSPPDAFLVSMASMEAAER